MEIYEALKKDHDNVKSLLQQLVGLTQEQSEERHELIKMIRDELVPHARAEEAVFYNCMRELDVAKDLVMHGYAEHMEAEAHLRMLQIRDTIDATWKDTAKKLQESVTHHIHEEETKIFGAARQLFTVEEAEMMGEAFENLKPEVRTEGIFKNTVDMVTNMMPPRFAAAFRTRNLDAILMQTK